MKLVGITWFLLNFVLDKKNFRLPDELEFKNCIYIVRLRELYVANTVSIHKNQIHYQQLKLVDIIETIISIRTIGITARLMILFQVTKTLLPYSTSETKLLHSEEASSFILLGCWVAVLLRLQNYLSNSGCEPFAIINYRNYRDMETCLDLSHSQSVRFRIECWACAKMQMYHFLFHTMALEQTRLYYIYSAFEQ